MIPGSNLLLAALTAIAPQTPAALLPSNGRVKNSIGQWVTAYGDPKPLNGSIQAVPKSVYQNLGLDYQKSYVSCYLVGNYLDIKRGESGDHMTYAGKRYQFLSESDWFVQDGWTGVLAVEVGDA